MATCRAEGQQRAVAAEIARAEIAPDQGDGQTPAEPDEAFIRFVATIADRWLTGPRERIASPGPVHSSRFRWPKAPHSSVRRPIGYPQGE